MLQIFRVQLSVLGMLGYADSPRIVLNCGDPRCDVCRAKRSNVRKILTLNCELLTYVIGSGKILVS